MRARIAQTQMAARQNERVPRVAHTNHAFASIVVRFVVRHGLVQVLVLDAVDFLQQVAQAVHEEFLLEGAQCIRAVGLVIDDANCRVALPDLVDAVLDDAVNDDGVDVAVCRILEVILAEEGV